jgi:hypothetical protein
LTRWADARFAVNTNAATTPMLLGSENWRTLTPTTHTACFGRLRLQFYPLPGTGANADLAYDLENNRCRNLGLIKALRRTKPLGPVWSFIGHRCFRNNGTKVPFRRYSAGEEQIILDAIWRVKCASY